MRVLGLRASNILKLVAVDIEPDSNIVKLTGANKQGKSSVLNAICMALGGSKMVPETPIHEGADSGFVSLDLGDIIVTRKFTATGDTLILTNAEGARFSSPQAMLDKLIGKLSFDPLKFIEDKKNQVNTLLSVVDIKVDYDQLKQLSGVAVLKESNPLVAIDKTIDGIKSMRTEINRDLTRAKKSLEAMGVPTKTERVYITELIAQKDGIVKNNQSVEAEDDKLDEMKKNMVYAVKTIEVINQNILDLHTKYEADLAALKLAFDKTLSDFQNDLTTNLGYQQNQEDAIVTQTNFVNGLATLPLDEIDAKIAAADKTNEAATKWETYSKAVDAVDPIQTEYNQLTEQLKAVENYKKTLLESTKFPVPGLGFANGTVTYNGLPLEQASSAELWHIGIAMGMALNPEFKVIMIRDASLLDKKHMAILENLAKEHDFQVWMEIVDESGEVGIYLEEGQVVKVN